MKIRTDRSEQDSFVTSHETTISGQTVQYRVLAEETLFDDDKGQAMAGVFSFTYLRTDLESNDTRPVIFAFNGGPGASSLWLHLGFFGAKRVKMSSMTNPNPLPPYSLESNPHCLLDSCDLVMIDPVNTGFGRLIQPEAADQFYGVAQDTRTIALFIENWLDRYNRHQSPRFLAGESYGTIRACMLLGELMGGPLSSGHQLPAVPINGIMLLGTSIAMPMLGNLPSVEPSVIALMSQAAVNHYHNPDNKPDLAAFAEQAWQFASTDYLLALFSGEDMTPEKRQEMVDKLVWFTGLPPAVFRHRLVIDDMTFRSRLLEDKDLDVGAYDGRYVMHHSEQAAQADPVADDPAMGKYSPVFAGAFKSELCSLLEIDLDREYRAINFAVNGQWSYDCAIKPTQALTAAMRRNKNLRLFFGSGLYDLAVPPGMVRYLAGHLDLDSSRVTIREYDSGHMPYIGEKSSQELETDIRAFLTDAIVEAQDG